MNSVACWHQQVSIQGAISSPSPSTGGHMGMPMSTIPVGPRVGPEDEPCVRARQPFGRITIANSDAAAYAYTDAAIDQGYRAVQELCMTYARLTSSQVDPQTGPP